MHLVRNGGDDASDEALRDAYVRGAMDAQEQMNAEAARRKKRRRRSEYRLSAGAGSIIAGLIVAGAVIHLDVDPEAPASPMQMRQEQGIDVVGQTGSQPTQGAVVVPAPSSIQSTEPSPPPQDSGAPPPPDPADPATATSNLEPVPTLEPGSEVTAQDPTPVAEVQTESAGEPVPVTEPAPSVSPSPSPTPSPLRRALCRLLCSATDLLLGR